MGVINYTPAQINEAVRKSLTPYVISLQLEVPATTTCTNADQWYNIDGDFADGSSNGFTYVATGGIITFTGTCSSKFFFLGDSDLDIGSSAATISYGLFYDDGQGGGYVESSRFTSTTEFSANETTKSVGTNGETPAAILTNGKLKVMVKSSVGAVTVNHRNLKITLLETGCEV